MSSDERDESEDDGSGVEIPKAPQAGGIDPEDLEPPAQPIADAERDAENLGPEIPTAPAPGEADSEAVGLFWKLVLVFNVAVFGVTVGPMIGFFLDDWDLGLQVFAVGALAFAYGLLRYYRFRQDRTDEPENA